MIVTCESCKARYKLDDSKVTARGAKITCPKCRHIFVVYAQGAPAEAQAPSWSPPPAHSSPGAASDFGDDEPTRIGGGAAPPRPSAMPTASMHFGAAGMPTSIPVNGARANPTLAVPMDPPAPDTHVVGRGAPPPTSGFGPTASPVTMSPGEATGRAASLDFRKVGVTTWKVKVRIGLIYDFSDIKTLRKYIQDGRVTPADVISYDGKNWKPIGDIPDLDAFFVETYERLGRERGPAELPSRTPTGPVVMPAPSPGPSVPLSEPTPSTFRDPFDDLKNRQRDRLALKRTGSVTVAEPRRSRAAIVVVALIAVVAVIGGAGFLAWKSIQPAGQSNGVLTRPSPATPHSPADDLREDIDKMLREGSEPVPPGETVPAEIAPYDQQLIPVGPRGGTVERSNLPPGATPVVPRSVPTTTKATTTTTTTVATSRDATASDHEAVGDVSAKNGDWKGAAKAYQNAASMEPGSGRLMKKLGDAQFKSGDLDGAQASLKVAAEKGQKDAWKVLGHIAREQGDTSNATYSYQQYLAGGPKDAADVEKILKEMNGG